MCVWWYASTLIPAPYDITGMTVEQFIDMLYGWSFWLIAASFIAVALYAVYARMRG